MINYVGRHRPAKSAGGRTDAVGIGIIDREHHRPPYMFDRRDGQHFHIDRPQTLQAPQGADAESEIEITIGDEWSAIIDRHIDGPVVLRIGDANQRADRERLVRGMPAYRIKALAGRDQFVFPTHPRAHPLARLNSIQSIFAGNSRHGLRGQDGSEHKRGVKARRRAPRTCNESPFSVTSIDLMRQKILPRPKPPRAL